MHQILLTDQQRKWKNGGCTHNILSHFVNALSEQTLSEQAEDNFCMNQSIRQPPPADGSSNRKIIDKKNRFSTQISRSKNYSLRPLLSRY